MPFNYRKEEVAHSSLSSSFQNRILFYFLLFFVIALLVLKMPMSVVYYETVRIALTFAPLLVIITMASIGFYNYKKHPDFKEVIRKFYLLFTLKFLLAIFAFYILYAPTLFYKPILAFLVYLKTIFALEGFFYLLSYILVAAIVLVVVFIAFKAYQKSKGVYWGSIRALTRKSLYALFAFYLLAFGVSAAAYPEAYTPLTDMLGDTLYTFSAGNIQAFKGPDVSSYKKLKSLGDFTSSLSASISETSKNISESNDEYKAKLADATGDLKDSIKDSVKDLEDKIDDDISGTFSISGGTISGNVTINEALTIENTTFSKSIIPQSNSIFDLGSASKSFAVAYIGKVSGLDVPTADSDAATKGYVDDLVALGSGVHTFPLLNTAGTISLEYNISNLKITAGEIDTIQPIGTDSIPTFRGILPYDDASDLGSSSNYFDNAYIDKIYAGSLDINPGNDDLDTRIRGEGDDNLFYVDASEDRIGIGTNAPAAKFTVANALTDDGGTAAQISNSLVDGNFATNTNIVALNILNAAGWSTSGSSTMDISGTNVIGMNVTGEAGAFTNVHAKSVIGVSSWPVIDWAASNMYISDFSAAFYGHSDENYGNGSNPRQYTYYAEKPMNAAANFQFAGAGTGAGSGLFLGLGAANAAQTTYGRIYSPAASELRISTYADGDIMSFKDGSVEIGMVTGEVLKLGAETDNPTADPLTINLGGTYSTAAGLNPKISLYKAGGLDLGFGFSMGEFDYMAHSTGKHTFWSGTTRVQKF